MTYFLGQRATLRTEIRNEAGELTNATVLLTMKAPDGTASTPAVINDGTGLYSAQVTFDQAGDWLRVWSTSGAVVTADADQVHVIEAALRLVGLTEVKEHGNITSTANDRELLDFIGTAQQMVEALVGVTVPQAITETAYVCSGSILLGKSPVMSVQSITEYGATVDPSLYAVDIVAGSIIRTDCRRWHGSSTWPLSVTYRAGRNPIPEGIRWAGKEQTIHLWRSTQAQRGGRARGDIGDAAVAAGFGMPNRVRDALHPFLLAPGVA